MTEKKEFTYEIAGKKFVQRKLVLAQVMQLAEITDGIRFPKGASAVEIGRTLGNRLFKCMAVALTEEGKSPREKDIDELADWLAWNIDVDHAEVVKRAVEDFFVCNPIVSFLETLSRMADEVSGTIGEAMARDST